MVNFRSKPRPSPEGRYDALYARYSSHAQDESTSVALQVEACERAAGRPLVQFVDMAKTGRTTGGRAELLRLISEAEAGRIGRLYVYKFDRLGRAAETHVLVEDLEACGVEVVSVTEGTNALARGVQLVVAADYSRALAERTRAGLVQRHRDGWWTGGPPPYGYRIVAAGESRKRLAINPEEAEVVRFIVDAYLGESIGLKEVARRLRARRVPTRSGRPWGFGSVRSIVLNRMLVGDVVYLRRCFRLDRSTGRRLPRFNDAAGHLVRRDESLRIIDDPTFERIRVKLEENAVDRPRDVRQVRPFTRCVFCSTCGTVCYARKSANSKGVYYYYGCGRRHQLGPEMCPNSRTVREDRLMARVQASVAAVFDDVDGILAQVVALARAALDANRDEAAKLRAELAEIDRTLSGLCRLLVDPDIEQLAKRTIAREIAEAESKREQARQAMDAVSARAVDDVDDLMAACRVALMEARADFARVMTPAQVNRFVAEVVGPIEVRPDGQLVQKHNRPQLKAVGGANSGGRI